MKEIDTIIIGAGPAGLFSAIHLENRSVLILERKASAGRKLLIAGSGRCNLTHSGELSDFFRHYGENSKFLRPALHAFSNLELVDFFTERGLPVIIDKNGKVFPHTERSADVLAVLLSECKKKKIQIRTNERVNTVSRRTDHFLVTTELADYQCRSLLIATGGLSYPSTGSSGDGYVFASGMGHTITQPKPSLSPVFILSYTMSSIAGVSLQNRTIQLFRQNKKISEHKGDIGFTHKGLSGPGILDFSRFMAEKDELRINFLDNPPETFRQMIIQTAETSGKTMLSTFLKSFELPRSLVNILLTELDISPELTLSNLTKEIRSKLIRCFCEYSFIIERVGGFNMAMATHGGVSLKEVSSKTMQSKLIPGLYFAGEVLDIDGDTGGYNLQAAFSTAFLAAQSINMAADIQLRKE